MKTFLIDARNTTKPYNFCLLSTLEKKKYPFKFFGYIPGDWRGKINIDADNLFLPISRGTFENKKTQRFVSNFTKPFEILLGYTHLRGKIDQMSTLHFLWFTVPSIEQYIIPYFSQSKIIHTAHNLLPHREYSIDFSIFKKIYSHMDRILVHDNETKEKIEKMFSISNPVLKLDHGNVELFYKTFDTTNASESKSLYSNFFSSLKRPIFLFMGPIKKYKGFETLLSAIEILNKKNLKYSVVIKDKNKKTLKNLYYLNYSPPYSKLGLIYRNIDAVILPYSKGSQSITMFEAGYFSKAVIVSALGGLKETVRDKKDGFIFKKDVPFALAEKMEHLINTSSKQILTMGENFKDYLIKKYSWDGITEKLIKIYEEREESLNWRL